MTVVSSRSHENGWMAAAAAAAAAATRMKIFPQEFLC
jgi:hypothetical protein